MVSISRDDLKISKTCKKQNLPKLSGIEVLTFHLSSDGGIICGMLDVKNTAIISVASYSKISGCEKDKVLLHRRASLFLCHCLKAVAQEERSEEHTSELQSHF